MPLWATDDDLVRAVRSGEDAAFAELLKRHRAWVWRLMRAVVQDPEHAEDLTQEAFYRVYRHAGDYSAQGKFVPYLKRIALNLASRFLREQRRESLLAAQVQREPARPDPLADPAAVLASRLLQQEVRDALEQLGPEQREALVLRYFTGLSVCEIARRTDCAEGTVKSRLHYARRHVRAALLVRTRSEDERPNKERSLTR